MPRPKKEAHSRDEATDFRPSVHQRERAVYRYILSISLSLSVRRKFISLSLADTREKAVPLRAVCTTCRKWTVTRAERTERKKGVFVDDGMEREWRKGAHGFTWDFVITAEPARFLLTSTFFFFFLKSARCFYGGCRDFLYSRSSRAEGYALFYFRNGCNGLLRLSSRSIYYIEKMVGWTLCARDWMIYNISLLELRSDCNNYSWNDSNKIFHIKFNYTKRNDRNDIYRFPSLQIWFRLDYILLWSLGIKFALKIQNEMLHSTQRALIYYL